MQIFTPLFSMLCAAALAQAQPSVVPGSVAIVANNGATTIAESQKITYVVTTTGVPTSDPTLGQTLIGIEIRGSRPDGGPRGWIATVLNNVPLSTFSGNGEWAIPAGYAGFTYFLRANLCFEKACSGSSNFQTSGSSQQFAITAATPASNNSTGTTTNGTITNGTITNGTRTNGTRVNGTNTNGTDSRTSPSDSSAALFGKGWPVIGALALVAALL